MLALRVVANCLKSQICKSVSINITSRRILIGPNSAEFLHFTTRGLRAAASKANKPPTFSSAYDVDFSTKLSCIQKYKQIHGHLLIPITYVIPKNSTDYPAELRGWSMGRFVKSIRGAYSKYTKTIIPRVMKTGAVIDAKSIARVEKPAWIQALDEVGFIWNLRDYKFEIIYKSIAAYKAKHEDCNIVRSFLIPKNSFNVDDGYDWPSDARRTGLKLGMIVDNIRNSNQWSKPQYRSRLEDLGLDYTPRIQKHDVKDIKLALVTFKKIFGHVNVPQKFVVPSTSEWDSSIHGMNIGISINSIRSNKAYAGLSEWLNEIGFVWKLSDQRYHTIVKPALMHFKELHGHMNVPQSFAIPLKVGDWPSQTRGEKLGRICVDIRYRNHYRDHHQELAEMGFDFTVKPHHLRGNLPSKSTTSSALTSTSLNDDKDDRFYKVILPALVRFKREYGHLLVPRKFVVPKGDINDVNESSSSSFSSSSSSSKSVKHAEASDTKNITVFTSDEKELNYKMNESWPEESWDLPLGKVVGSIRYNNYFKTHRPILEEMGFVFGPLKRGRGATKLNKSISLENS